MSAQAEGGAALEAENLRARIRQCAGPNGSDRPELRARLARIVAAELAVQAERHRAGACIGCGRKLEAGARAEGSERCAGCEAEGGRA